MSVNFDSSQLSVNEISNVLTGAIASGGQSSDVDDLDANEATDQLLSFGWASLFGGWPGSDSVDLATVTFDIADDATNYADLNIVKTSTAAGYNFDGQSQQIAVVDGSSDSSGASDTATSVVTVPTVVADTQHVYVSESTLSEDGSQVTVTLSYLADSASLTGVGMSLNFDSSLLTVSEISNVLSGSIAGGDQSLDDSNTDIDDDTDQLLSFGWASLFGGWPGSDSVDLATVTFDIADGATGSTGLNIVRKSTTAGYSFEGQSHEVVISAEATPVETETMASQLSIDSSTGVVTLAGEADYETVSDYNFTVTADNGTETVNQTVGLLVADQEVSSDSDTYTGTDGADVFALTDGSAQVASGEGADIFIMAPPSQEAGNSSDMHTLVDFESGVDSIDLTAILAAVGYTESNLTQYADMSADVLDLINADDSSLDNMFGGSFDDTSNVLTLFADTNPVAGETQLDTLQVELDDSSVIDKDDITVSFIA
jgi:hypothetical protein